MQKQDEYEQLGGQMDELAAEYGRTHDPQIKTEIQELIRQRLQLVHKGEAVDRSRRV